MTATGVLDIVTEVFVPGRPRTKGSLDLVPRTRPCGCCVECRAAGGRIITGTYAKEAVDGSKEWRKLMAYAVVRERRMRLGASCAPADGPVGVRALFWLPEAVDSGPDVLPIVTGMGDADKLTRNLLDALTDAGAYHDDVQVARLMVDRVTARAWEPCGVRIQAWRIPDWQAIHMRSWRNA